MDQAAEAKPDTRTCACHPDDRPFPCQGKFATSHCWRAAVYNETHQTIVALKNRDRSSGQQKLLDYLMRVRRALEEVRVTDLRRRLAAMADDCAEIVEGRMIYWRNSSDQLIRDGSENAHIAKRIRALCPAPKE